MSLFKQKVNKGNAIVSYDIKWQQFSIPLVLLLLNETKVGKRNAIAVSSYDFMTIDFCFAKSNRYESFLSEKIDNPSVLSIQVL